MLSLPRHLNWLLLIIFPISMATPTALESITTEVCGMSDQWTDGPGTEEQVLIELKVGTQVCFTRQLRGVWAPLAVLRFEGRQTGFSKCLLENSQVEALQFRVWKKTNTWVTRLGSDGDDLCLKHLTFVFKDGAAFTWRRQGSFIWRNKNEFEIATSERGQFQVLKQVTARVCDGYLYLDPGTGHNVRIAVETMNGENSCLTGSLKGSRTGYSDWVRGGTNIFQGLITEVCRLPVHQETKLRFRIVKDSGALPDDLCLNYVRLDFANNNDNTSFSRFLSEEEHDWHGENERALVATREDGTRSKLDQSHEMGGFTCQEVSLHCPDTKGDFDTIACCYNTGPISSKCFLRDPSHIATRCSLYSCYLYDQVVKRFGATNGCSVVPNSWLNEEACIIHDLCYSTIGANRTLCDRQLRENVNSIHFLHKDGYLPDITSAVSDVAEFGLQQVGSPEYDAAQWESMASQCHKCNSSEFC